DQAGSAAGVGNALKRWQADRDLAGVRGTKSLAKLPEAERQAWQKLWDDVADLLARAQRQPAPGKKPRERARPGAGRRSAEETKAAGEVSPPSRSLTGPAKPRRSVCAPAVLALSLYRRPVPPLPPLSPRGGEGRVRG